jgi:O-antigen/teichoic acid export membrane protein
MISMASLIYVGSTIYTIAIFIDFIIIMSLRGTDAVGVFTLGFIVAGLVQAPQRGAVAASIPVLSKAWKDKDYEKINLIYQRSGINLLIASLGIFLIVWLNYTDAVHTFKLKPAYLDSIWIFFFLGLARVVDLGTGVNSQIIGTSTFWRFEFISGMILLSLAVPLNYFLIKHYGIIGAGYSNLISLSVYNVIRVTFLKRKFNMQPFSIKTIYAVLFAILAYVICYFLFKSIFGFWAIVIKTLVFTALYGGSVIYFNLTPDILSVWVNVKNKAYKKKPSL